MIRQVPTSYKFNPEYEIEVKHPGGERKFLPIELITEHYISVRWGMSGTYDIFLKTNRMVARSIKARRKGDCLWIATEIEEVRIFVKEHLSPNKKTETDRLYQKHIDSMPKANPNFRKVQ